MEDNLNQLLSKLREAKPILKQPESLTDSIMDEIGKQVVRKTSPLLIWTRVGLSTAAALLLGLFLFQQTEQGNPTARASVEPVVESTIVADSTCMQMLGSEHLNYLQTYLCYLQQNAIDNKQFRTFPQQKN